MAFTEGDRKMMGYVSVLVAWISLCMATAQAGSGYEVKCDDEKCGFETSFNVGGGFVFKQVQGYCKSCNKETSLS